MLGNITNLILEGIRTHGILAVIIGVAIETIIVPLPSPLIVMAGGYILIPQGSWIVIALNALWIAVVAGIAQTIGSFLVYGFAYKLGKPFIEKYEKYHGVSWKEVLSFQKKFGKGRKETATLFTLRALPIMPLSVVSGVAGVIEMEPKKYTIATLLGVIPRNFILAILGFMLGEFYHLLAQQIDFAESIMTVMLVVMIVTYLVAHKLGVIEWLRKEILK
jgi:membrane protein DedA with SNARE-associated domain